MRTLGPAITSPYERYLNPKPVGSAQNTKVTNHFWFVTFVPRLHSTAQCGRFAVAGQAGRFGFRSTEF